MRKAWVLPAAGAFALGAAAAGVSVARQRFHARVAGEARALLLEAEETVGPAQLHARWETLPSPAQRYFRYAVPSDAPGIRTARLRHDGLMRMTPGGRWFPVHGEESFSVARPGFVWNGRMYPVPVAWIEARDRLADGHGEMLVKVYSLLTIAESRGPEIDQGSQLRWLAENVWFPYGYAGRDVQWDPVDERSARVTLRHTRLPVSAVVDIDDDGALASIRADRYRDVGGGRAVLTPWFGRCSEYRAFGGFRVPTFIEVGWMLPEGEFAAFRLRVTAIDYNVAHPF